MKIIYGLNKILIELSIVLTFLACNNAWAVQTTLPISDKNTQKNSVDKLATSSDKVTEGKLVTLDLSPYEKDLERIKKLQRDKIKLTLEKENQDLQKALGDGETDNYKNLINKIYVIDIVLTKKANIARLYIPGRGISIAKVGDKIGDDIDIVAIKKDKVVASVQLPDTQQFKNLPFHYGSS